MANLTNGRIYLCERRARAHLITVIGTGHSSSLGLILSYKPTSPVAIPTSHQTANLKLAPEPTEMG
jgi:hypothetical protein